jgi:uncharacterized damage-inducible protein DinB
MENSGRKAQLLDEIRRMHGELEAAIAPLTEAQMTQPGVNGEWSVKDTLAHITWWEGHMLRTLRTGHEELGPDILTEQKNAEVFAANRDRPLAEARAEFEASYQEVLAALEGWPAEALAQDETYEEIGWDTFKHYPEHTAAIRDWLASEGAAQ